MNRPSLAALLLLVALGPSAHADPCAGWTQLTPVAAPSARWAHAMAFDSIRGRAVLFGGRPGGLTPTLYDETWEWDGTNWSQKFPAHVPAARSGHAMAFDSKRGVVVMVGGFNGSIGLSDLWTWDGTDWSNPVPEGTPNVPQGRTGAALAYDSVRDKIVLYGGKNQGVSPNADCSDALWEWDGAAWTMIALSPSAEVAAETFGCNVGLAGYYDEARGVTTVTNGQRTVDLAPGFPDVLPAASARQVQLLGTAVYDSKVESGFLFFGVVEDPNFNAYVSRRSPGATDFEDLPTQAGPSPRNQSSVVYDSVRDKLVVFGGRVDESSIPVADNQTWVFRFDPPVIPARAAPSVLLCGDFQLDVTPPGGEPYTYQWQRIVNGTPTDLADGGTVSGTKTSVLRIFPLRAEDEGDYRVVVSNECGTTISDPFQAKAAESAWVLGGLGPTVSGPGLSYDSKRQRLVIFGGMVFQNNKVFTTNETWERRPVGWTRVFPAIAPTDRTESAMAYDPVRGVSVLYGGRRIDPDTGQSTVLQDVWEWDGSTWTQKPDGPGGRLYHAMLWDSERQRMQMFGGRNSNGNQVGDLWEYDGSAWTPRSPAGDPDYPGAGGVPVGREKAALAYDDDRKALVLHGGGFFGIGPGRQPGETWELVADQWKMRDVDPDLAPLFATIAGYHAARQRVAMFMTYGPGEGTTWEWDGTPPWKQLAGASPLGRERAGAVMAYDAARHRLAMYGGLGAILLNDEPELAYSDGIDPTCGLGGCGNGIVDPGEDCDPGAGATATCCDGCTFVPAGTACADGVCDAAGQCVAPSPTCGDGVVEAPEACDDGGGDAACCSPTCTVDPSGSCGDPCRDDRCVAGSCTTGTADATGCSAATSVLGYLGAAGGTLSTPDGSAMLALAPGTGPAAHYAIASGLGASAFGVGTPTTLVVAARFGPSGTAFSPPGAAITLRWPDDDDDGNVDGLGLDERLLTLFHDGAPIGTCLADAGCDRVLNAWSSHVTSFSELAIVGLPCDAAQQGRLRMSGGRLDARARLAGAVDPIADGLRVLVDGAGAALGERHLPAGAYSPSTKTGWKANKKRSRFKLALPGGTRAALVRRPGGSDLTLSANGFAAGGPPFRMTVAAGTVCTTASFGKSCSVKRRGKLIVCNAVGL